MSRTFKVDNPGKIRNQMMRTAAESLRRLSQKSTLDDETKDLTALLVYTLRRIDEGIEESAQAWEKRDYWIKAERFRQRWGWARQAANELEALVRENDWDRLPMVLAGLLPNFANVKITRFTRKPSVWQGAYARLMGEPAPTD